MRESIIYGFIFGVLLSMVIISSFRLKRVEGKVDKILENVRIMKVVD